jgi:2-desacetyl-2-hydroxyethyl bacteriochlorophyllide A dehydrogenase
MNFLLALMFYGVGDIRIEEVPKPICGLNEALVRISYAGICGSDLHVFRKGMFVQSVPIIMGHEFSGIIEVVGSDVTDLKPGDHVIGDPRVSCNQCKWCQEGSYNLCPELGFIGEVSPGCFAEYLVMGSQKLFKIPSSIDLKKAALIEPLSVAVHIVQNSDLCFNKKIGIVGAGPIGLLTLLLARNLSKDITLIDISPFRLEKAKIFGANRIIKNFPKNSSERVEVVIEAVGIEDTLNKSLAWLSPHGRLVMGGIFENDLKIHDPNVILNKELNLVGINAYTTKDIEKAIELISNKNYRFDEVITDVLPLSDAMKGFKLLTNCDKKSLKVLLSP